VPARPTPVHLAAIARAIRDGATSEQACHAAGIDPALFAAWMRRGARAESGPHHLFHRTVRKAEADCALRCLEVVNDRAEGKRSLSARMLECRHGLSRDGMADMDFERPPGRVTDTDIPIWRRPRAGLKPSKLWPTCRHPYLVADVAPRAVIAALRAARGHVAGREVIPPCLPGQQVGIRWWCSG